MIRPSALNEGKEPISVLTMPDIRWHMCDVKTLNLIPAVLASQKAMEAGCQETILVRPGGRVTECAHSNVAILKDGALITAPTDELILPGISRAHLIRAAKTLGIPVKEEPFDEEELFTADEVIVTSSSKPCLRVEKINGESAGGKDPVPLEKLRRFVVEEIYRETE